MEILERKQMFCEKTANGEFERELAALINRYSIDACVNIEDFVLAEFLCDQITSVENVQRELLRLRKPTGEAGYE